MSAAGTETAVVSAEPRAMLLQSQDFRVVFESAPSLYLVLTPDLKSVGASDAYDLESGSVKSLMDEGLLLFQKLYDPDVLLPIVRWALDEQHTLEVSPCTA